MCFSPNFIFYKISLWFCACVFYSNPVISLVAKCWTKKYCFFIVLILCCFLSQTLLPTFQRFKSNQSVATKYFNFLTILLKVNNFIFYLILLTKRNQILCSLQKSYYLLKAYSDFNNKNIKSVSFVKFLVLSLILGGYIYQHCIYTIPSTMNMITSETVSLESYALLTTKLCSLPVSMFFTMTLYNYVHELLTELESTEHLYSYINGDQQLTTLSEVEVEDESSEIVYLDSHESLNPRDLITCTVYKKIAELYFEVRKLHTKMRQFFFGSVSVVLVSITCSFPIVLVYYDNSTSLKLKNLVSLGAQICFLTVPIFSRVGLDYKRRSVSREAHCKLYRMKNLQVRKAMRKLALLARDPFPDSSSCLFDLDSELLLLITDLTSLIATTLFSH